MFTGTIANYGADGGDGEERSNGCRRRLYFSIVWLMSFVSVIICTVISPSTCRLAGQNTQSGICCTTIECLGNLWSTWASKHIANKNTSQHQSSRDLLILVHVRHWGKGEFQTPNRNAMQIIFFLHSHWFFGCPIWTTGVLGPCPWLDNWHQWSQWSARAPLSMLPSPLCA